MGLYSATADGFKKSPSPLKGIYKEYKDLIRIFSVNVRVLYNAFLANSRGPGGFRKLREAYRIHFHRSWYLLVPGVTSYSQKP